MSNLTDEERAELDRLRRNVELCSLGDRPQSPGVATLRRIRELEARERGEVVPVTPPRDVDERYRLALRHLATIATGPRSDVQRYAGRALTDIANHARSEHTPTAMSDEEMERRWQRREQGDYKAIRDEALRARAEVDDLRARLAEDDVRTRLAEVEKTRDEALAKLATLNQELERWRTGKLTRAECGCDGPDLYMALVRLDDLLELAAAELEAVDAPKRAAKIRALSKHNKGEPKLYKEIDWPELGARIVQIVRANNAHETMVRVGTFNEIGEAIRSELLK